jgi:hypothetical protein
MREQIDENDLLQNQAMQDSEESQSITHIYLGSKQKPQSFAEVETQFSGDAAFLRFRKDLGVFFTRYFQKEVRFTANDTVSKASTLLIITLLKFKCHVDYSLSVHKSEL